MNKEKPGVVGIGSLRFRGRDDHIEVEYLNTPISNSENIVPFMVYLLYRWLGRWLEWFENVSEHINREELKAQYRDRISGLLRFQYTEEGPWTPTTRHLDISPGITPEEIQAQINWIFDDTMIGTGIFDDEEEDRDHND